MRVTNRLTLSESAASTCLRATAFDFTVAQRQQELACVDALLSRQLVGVSAAGGVAALVGRFQILHAQVQVKGGGFQFHMTQHQLDVADVAAVLQQASGERVPEQVTTPTLAQLCPLDQVVNMRGEATGMHALTATAQKQRW